MIGAAIEAVIEVLYFLLPAYFANMAPILFKGTLHSLAKPIDGGKKWRGKEIFGSHKTWRGVLVAVLVGLLVFWIQQRLYWRYVFKALSLFNYEQMPIVLGALLGFGAILGDLAKSFAKRRLGKPSGARWFPFDQIDYPLGAMILGSLLFVPPLQVWIIGIVLSIILSSMVNFVAHKIGLKEVQW
ncbi:MAG TPA: CDP-archaeol synthase [Candidatus Nanoarchaeia archaeon]|nr:CDP-archaeol synthase [Candidatus Nanoarchaeia archaeon]